MFISVLNLIDYLVFCVQGLRKMTCICFVLSTVDVVYARSLWWFNKLQFFIYHSHGLALQSTTIAKVAIKVDNNCLAGPKVDNNCQGGPKVDNNCQGGSKVDNNWPSQQQDPSRTKSGQQWPSRTISQQ